MSDYEIREYGHGTVRVKIPKWLLEPEKEADLAVLNTLGSHASEIESEVRARLPKRSGTLSKSFYISDVLPYGRHRYAVRFLFDEQLAPYWKAVLYGHGEDKEGERIFPRTQRALAFPWEAMGANPASEDGRWIFSSVAMAVVKPNRAVQEGLREAAAKLTGRLGTDFIAFLLR